MNRSMCRRLAWLLVGLVAVCLAFQQAALGSLSVRRRQTTPTAADVCRVHLLAPISLRAARIRAFEGELAPTEVRLLDDAADGRLDQHTLLRAALIASGATEPQQIARYERRVACLIDQLRAALAKQPGSAAETAAPQRAAGERAAPQQTAGEKATPEQTAGERVTAEAILRFMHQEVFSGGYQLPHTDLRRTLDEGRYNCVTGTVLYLTLAEALGIEGCGLEMPRHAMVRLMLAGRAVDVETTCAEWFSLEPRDRLVHAAQPTTLPRGRPGTQSTTAAQPPPAGGRTGTAPAREVPAALRALAPAELAAMVYYNRGVDRLAEGRFAEAAAANAKALRLDPLSRTAYGNLLATINNWAVDRAGRGEFVGALALLERGRELDAAYEPFRLNYLHVACQWSNSLCRQGRGDWPATPRFVRPRARCSAAGPRHATRPATGSAHGRSLMWLVANWTTPRSGWSARLRRSSAGPSVWSPRDAATPRSSCVSRACDACPAIAC